MKKLCPKLIFPVLLAAVTILPSCRKNKTISDQPTLEYRGYEENTYDNGLVDNFLFELFFTDGDGNVGFEGDIGSIDDCDSSSYNLFIRYFEKTDGVYQEVFPADSCSPFHNILPDLTPEGQNKTLEGNIFANFIYSAYPTSLEVDSVKFEFKLEDREGNETAWVSSDPIAVSN